MKKLSKIGVLLAVAVMAVAVMAVSANVTGDYQRAVGLATGALSGCLSDARAAGNTILDSGFAGSNEGDWNIVFCGRQSPTQSPAQFIGSATIENWQVVRTRCEFPAPTSNPCPVF